MGPGAAMNAKKAIYTGSFDPVTNGHLDIIRRARDIFGALTVLIIPNGTKNPLFSLEERCALLEEITAQEPGVTVSVAPGGLLADYMKTHGYGVIVRGLRGPQDVEHELTNAYYNKAFLPGAETVFLPARPEWTFVSSTAVREAVRYGADVSRWVPPGVARALAAKYRK